MLCCTLVDRVFIFLSIQILPLSVPKTFLPAGDSDLILYVDRYGNLWIRLCFVLELMNKAKAMWRQIHTFTNETLMQNCIKFK